jgi:hypothetical protein
MWWLLLAPVLAGGVGVWSGLRYQRRRLRRWRDAVTACGLEVAETSSPAAWRLRLAARAWPVEVRIEEASKRNVGTKVVVVVPGPPGFSAVRIRRELENPLPWGREIEVGDETFDAAFYLGGPPSLVCALLDSLTRRLLADLNAAGRLEIVSGEIQAEMFDLRLPFLLPFLLELARRFTHPVDIAQGLADNARLDPEPGVRLQTLLLLVREFPADPRTTETLRAACLESDPQIRLRAAMELGAEGRDLLIQFAEEELAEDVNDGRNAQAIRILGRELPYERIRAILARALRRRRIQTAYACLEALGRSAAAAAVEELAKVMAIESGELAAAAADALGTTGSPAAERPLIEALERERADLRVAAAYALAHVGSAAAVLPLKDAAERFSRDADLRRATRQAIAEIHSRLQGASPGQLSLAGDAAGQLSLAQAEAGQLSFTDDVAGQLSLPAEEAGRLSLGGGEEG